MIDHEKVLKAYIRHVLECEGTDFLYGTHGYPHELDREETEYLLKAHRDVCGED